jgi:hypothetical protein
MDDKKRSSSTMRMKATRRVAARRNAPAARLDTFFASTMVSDEREAITSIAEQLLLGEAGTSPRKPSVVLFYCSPSYNLNRLAEELGRAFAGITVIGCTSSGQIDDLGFRKGGISAVAMDADDLVVTPYCIPDISKSCIDKAKAVTEKVMADRARQPESRRSFGLLLIDGLSMAEENLTATLYQMLGDVPIVGGSAGDDLEFKRTHVFVNGRFESDAALFAVFTTSLPFTTFKLQHFAPSDRMLVITSADPGKRTVYEIDGEPAADAYARLVGVSPEQLDAQVFSANPIVLEIDGESYVRSIAKINADKSITFLCAIDEGMVLSIGTAVDAMKTLDEAFEAVREELPYPTMNPFILGCDCILRRLEFEKRGIDGRIGELMAANRVFGFSTYGEQFNGIHVNQTFTGVAIGGQFLP